MPKAIKLVNDLVTKAMNNEGKTFTRSSYEVIAQMSILTVAHYNTVILHYDYLNKQINDWNGWSVSDRDALNSILELLGHPSRDGFVIHKGTLKRANSYAKPIGYVNFPIMHGGGGLHIVGINEYDFNEIQIVESLAEGLEPVQFKEIKEDKEGREYFTWGRQRYYLAEILRAMPAACHADTATQRSPFEMGVR